MLNEPKTILVIEDDPGMGRMLRNLLTLNSYSVVVAHSGSEGIQKSFEWVPDLILCDIRMKPVDGFQVINTLKQSPITRLIPFVFLTGKTDLQDIRFGMQMGADDYIAKPFDNDELLDSIDLRIRKYDELVEQSMRDLYSLIHLIPCGVIIFGEDRILDVNRVLLDLLGYEKEELLAIPVADLLDGAGKSKVVNVLKRSYLGLKDQGRAEVQLKRKGGDFLFAGLDYFQTRTFKGRAYFMGIVQVNGETAGHTREYSELINCMPKDSESMKSLLAEDQQQVSGQLAGQLATVFTRSGTAGYSGDGSSDSPVASLLSRRELQVMELSCQGLAIKEIAGKLFISDRTVEKHRASVMEKTGSRNIVQALIYLIRNGHIRL